MTTTITPDFVLNCEKNLPSTTFSTITLVTSRHTDNYLPVQFNFVNLFVQINVTNAKWPTQLAKISATKAFTPIDCHNNPRQKEPY